MFKDIGIEIAYFIKHTLTLLMANPKEQTGSFEKTGKYEINCSDCNEKYYGQTPKAIETQYYEHFVLTICGRNKSYV